MIWYQVLLLNINSIQTDLIWSIDGTLTGTIPMGQGGPESNGNDRVLRTLPRASELDCHH